MNIKNIAKARVLYISIFIALFSTSIFATEFCNGWSHGYKTGYKKTAPSSIFSPTPPFMGCSGDSFFVGNNEPDSPYERGYIAGLQDGMLDGLKASKGNKKTKEVWTDYFD